MKWKTALTAEEAALFVTGLSYIGSLAESEELLKGHERFVNSCPLKLRDGEDYTESLEEFKNLEYRLHEAVKINEAIWDEIEHAWLLQERGEGRGSTLVLDSWCWNGGVDESLSKLGCKASKESLAEWFYEMDGIDKAKMLFPNFEPHNFSNTKSLKNPTNQFSYDNYPVKLQDVDKASRIEPDFDPNNDFRDEAAELKNSPVNNSTTLSPKTKNSYLRTIRVLADALLSNGLTDNDSGDARLILKKLAQKSKEAPIKERALANYLKEARELP